MSQENIPERFRQRIKKAKEQQLEELDLSNELDANYSEKLTRIPDEVFDLTHLKVLNLSSNQLKNLPDSISNLSKLTTLDLINNQLKNLPDSISNLSKLTTLDVSSNQLENLPDSISNLSNLIALDVSSNQLANLPDSISNLSNLTILNLSSNQLANLPDSISNLFDLTWLDVSRNQLTNLPDSISNLLNLTELNVSRNQLKNLPDSISNLSDLTKLDLRDNQLANLPDSISNLSDLTWLYLSSNRLDNLPDFISNLSKLTTLDISSNQLKNLPDFISNFSNLTELYASRNKLANLPDSISNLSNLTKLDLRDNQLKKLPNSISNLSNLKELYLTNNELKNLPESISNLSSLKVLYLRNNPLEIPPIEVANKGIEAIREYFRQLREEGTDYIYEAKLLIVGEAGAGKTTLAKKIDNPQYQLDINEKSTEGIDITKWSFPLDNEREFKVNIWDFGGQEIYHATHQFFLTKRSLYALLADTRKEDTDFYYWLNVVELLSNNSPLLIVKNEKGDRYIDIDENSLRGRFENLKESLATNLKDNRGLNAILDSIKYHIAKLPHVGSALPKTWKRVRETLEQDQRNYISLEEYLNICQDNDFTRREDQLQLSGYLHDLGVCLHFQDSPLLKNTVILKPEWGTDAVYKVLDDKQVINNLGKFTSKDLDNIWSDEQYLFKQAELLELMMRFKLCYQIPGTNDTYIAPQLLTKTKPNYNWDETDNLILRYTYEFMPKGIITQLIVAMHQHIYQQKYVWRSGVLLHKDNTLAEVIEYYDKREIKIRVSGKQKKDLLTIISHELDKIHASYPRLKYRQLIPCNCSECHNQPEPYFHPFDVLLKAKEKGQREIQCQKSFHMVDVLSLIDDVIIWHDSSLLEEEILYQQYSSREVHIHIDQGDHTANQSRNINISGNAQVTASGAGAFNQLSSFDNNPNKKELQVSLLHPKRLAKGFSSTITVQIYLPDKRHEVVARIEQLRQLDSSELIENNYLTALIAGQTVIIKLSSPAISFSDEVLKQLRGAAVNRVTFTAQPHNECAPGRQVAVLSLRDSKTNEEYESIPCFFIIDDFAFDHVSKPRLSYVSSLVTGIGSLALFTFSFLQKLDATLGILAGIVGAALALLFGVRPTFLYKRQHNTSLENLVNTLASRPINVSQVQRNYTDSRRTQNINAETINASGGAAFGFGDISGTVANTINQLPNFDDQNKTTLKQLLIQLHNTVIEENLDTDEKEEALEQINAIASALQNPHSSAVKKSAKRAITMLRGIAADLPSDADMLAICNQLPDLMGKVF